MARSFFIADLACVGTVGVDRECGPKIPGNWVKGSGLSYNSYCNATQCMVIVFSDATAIKNDNTVLTLAEENLDATVASLGQATRNRIQNGLTNKGIPITLTDYILVRDFLTALGQFFNPAFDLDSAFGWTP